MPPNNVVATIRAEVPGITDEQLRYQHSKFIDHFQKTGNPMADWNAAWRNWMRTANERGDFGATSIVRTANAVDDKVNGWMDLANSQPSHLRAINE